MDLIRRFFSFVNRPAIGIDEVTGSIATVPSYYLGHTYAAQPNSDELRRAAHILTARTKKDLEKNLLPMLSLCFEGTLVVLRDDKSHKSSEYDIRRIVLSCVDAKNQKLLAIFYHNDSPCIASPITARGLELHLFLCRNKDSSKMAANKIGDLLTKEYQMPSRPVKKLEEENVSKGNYEELDYENISRFFQQKVFNVSESTSRGHSVFSTPSSSVSTFATTTGCDSGCASTIASVDIKAEEYVNGFQEPIQENDESDSDKSSILQLSNKDINSIFHNRYSVHYDLEEDEQEEYDEKSQAKKNILVEETFEDDDSVLINGLKTPELQRLLDMGETNI